MKTVSFPLLLLVLTLFNPTTSGLFFKKKQRSAVVVPACVANSTKDYEFEDEDNFIKHAFKSLGNNIKGGLKKMKKSSSKIKDRLIKSFEPKRGSDSDYTALKDFVKFQLQEKQKREMQAIKKNTRPGAKGVVSETALNHLKNFVVPILLDSFLSEPLILEYEYDRIYIENIFIDLDEIDIEQLYLRLDESENQILVEFPRSPVKLILDTVLSFGAKLRGNVVGDFVLEGLVVKIKFVEDMTQQYFKPRILMQFNEFKLHDNGGFNIGATFQNIPDAMLKLLLFMFNKKIKGSIEHHLNEAFVNESSEVLNWVIDSYYPHNVNFLQDDLRFNLDLTQAPQVKGSNLFLYMVGEFFSVDYVSEEDFMPNPNPVQMKLPRLAPHKNLALTLSKTMILTFLNTLFNKRLIELPRLVPRYNRLTIDLLSAKVTITPEGIEIRNGKLNLFEKSHEDTQFDNPDYIKNVSLTLDIPHYDLVSGKLGVRLLKLQFLDDNDNRFYQLTRTVLNVLIQQVVTYLFSKDYEIYPLELGDGLEIDTITFELRHGYAVARSNFVFNPSKNDLVEEVDRLI